MPETILPFIHTHADDGKIFGHIAGNKDDGILRSVSAINVNSAVTAKT
jgi:hypothetical protein